MKKILVIDDDVSIVRLVTQHLKASGYEVFGANDAYQGFKKAKETQPDLILLDLKMPAGGGVHTFENLKSSIYTSNIPVIIFTAFQADKVKKLVMEMGADAFLPKPFSSTDLLNKIKEFIGD